MTQDQRKSGENGAQGATLPVERDDAAVPGGIAIVRMEQPGRPVVVLDLELIQRLERTIRSLPRDLGGFILASASERVFIAGADLESIQSLNDEQLERYLAYGQRVFGMLCELPCPTAAAINGAALGGGLEVAMHCDALVGAPSASGKPYPIGLPEAGLQICPGWGGTNLLPARIDPAEAIRRTAEGKPLTFDEARSAGMFDAVADSAEGLLDAAKAWLASARERGGVSAGERRDGLPLRWIGRSGTAAKVSSALDEVESELPGTGSARAVASAVRAGLDSGWEAALEVERTELVRLRGTPEGREAIKAFFERSTGKNK